MSSPARQRSATTLVAAQPVAKKSGIHPSERQTGTCQCNEEALSKFCVAIDPSKLDFHSAFRKCSVCDKRPAAHLCCTTMAAFCETHSAAHFESFPAHHIFMNYEIWQYERCFFCYACNGFCCTERFDSLLEPMYLSKGAFCPEPVTQKESDRFAFGRLLAGSSTAQGWRSDNEDCHVVSFDLPSTHFHLFGVFDGHGGPLVSRFIGKALVPTFDTTLAPLLDDANVVQSVGRALQRSFLAVDDTLCNDLGDDCRTCGSTACVVALDANHTRLWCANAGDTRAVLCRNGKAVDLSRDHRPTLGSEQERITGAGSSVAEDRVEGMLAVSRAFGDFDFKQARNLPPHAQAVTCFPDVVDIQIEPDDTFVLIACDGIWDCLSSQEGVDLVREEMQHRGSDAATAAERLIDRCVAREIPDDGVGTDNMSVVIVRL